MIGGPAGPAAASMTPEDPTRAIALAIRELTASPSDFPAWLMAASHLGTAGRSDAAAHVFRRLGAAACATGQVALAIGCARWLRQRNLPDDGLVDDLVARHAAGSGRIDEAARLAPPAPRGKDAPPPALGSLDEAARAVRAAVDAAAQAVIDHAPARLPPTPLVGALGPADLRALVDVIDLRAVPRGAVIVDVGEPARALYWIATGAVAVLRGGQRLGDLRAGAFFGEIALVGGTARTARVTATEDTLLLELPAAAIEAAAARQPALARVLAQHARARLLANVMRTSPVFTLLPEAERAELLGRFETTMAQAGERFVRRGEGNDHLWIVVSGQVEVRDGATVLARLGAGDGVGEMSLLAAGPATADVVAVTPAALLRLSARQFHEVADRHPEVLAELARLADERAAANAAIVHDADDLIV
jgi:CRP-like cAMP-binding protein